MARLASTHHASGPGDPPRRKRGRPSKQGLAEPAESSSVGSKRAASESVELVHTKRTKRVTTNGGDEVSIDEEEEVQQTISQPPVADTIEVPRPSSAHAGPSHRRRHSEPFVAGQEEEDEDDLAGVTPPRLPATQPAPGLTPHLERLGSQVQVRPLKKTSRRARMSMPAKLHLTNVDETDGLREVQFAPLSAVLNSRDRRRLRRNHLGEEMNHIEDHKKNDAKLKKDYADLCRRLRDKEALISDLELQLEASRLGNIDISEDHTAELTEKLEEAKKHIEELKNSSAYDPQSRETSEFAANDSDSDSDDGDDDALMLVDPEDLDISHADMQAEPTANGYYATRALASSQVTMESLTSMSQTTKDILSQIAQSDPDVQPDKLSDQAIQRYEAEIKEFARRLGEVEGALRVVTLELQNMHVLPVGASVERILTELRHVLEDMRFRYEQRFPDSLAAPTNAEFLKQIMDELEGTSQELLDKTVSLEKHSQRCKMLQAQYEGTMDLLDTAEKSNEAFREANTTLKAEMERKNQDLALTQDQVEELQLSQHELQKVIEGKDAQINGQLDELEDKDTANDRFCQAMDEYRRERDALTATMTQLEEDQRKTLEQMEQEHAVVVQDLQGQLNDQTEARYLAENDAQNRGEYNEQLESQLKNMEEEFAELDENLTQLRQRLSEETEARRVTEDERDEAYAGLYAKENQLENLNETLTELETELASLRKNLDSERAQRQQTEKDLDDANAEIESLNTQVHNAGLQANELRNKLFEVQQLRDETIAQMEEDADARIQALEESLDAETEQRKSLQEDKIALERQLALLEQDMANTQDALTNMTNTRDTLQVDRDEQVASLNRQLEDLKQKHAALENSTNSTIDSLQATITDLTNDNNGLQATVQTLENAAVKAAEDHADEIRDRDGIIDRVETELEQARNENVQLDKENKSLAERVENEANELLNIMGAHAEESNALRTTIATQESHIADLRAQYEDDTTAHEQAISARLEEIEGLTLAGEARAAHILALEAQIEELKQRFRTQTDDLQSTLDNLMEANRQTIAQQEELADATKQRAMDALREVADMKVEGLNIQPKGVDLHKVVHGKVLKVNDNLKVTKKTKKDKSGGSRVKKIRKAVERDSGFGFGADEDEEYVDGADEVIEA